METVKTVVAGLIFLFCILCGISCAYLIKIKPDAWLLLGSMSLLAFGVAIAHGWIFKHRIKTVHMK